MRYAIVSDVHGNLQAFNAVLTDIFSLGVDQIVSLGDLVGYGPNPAEVLELAYTRVAHFVLGNHDAVIAGSLNPAAFNERARRMIEWTASEVDGKASDFLAQLPHALTDSLFRCTHGSPVCPGAFSYLLEGGDALDAWETCPEQIFFVGHSHVPGLFVLGRSGTPHWLEPTDFAAETHKRYIVNVGSVGEPRNGDVRASYCLLDADRAEVRFRQVPFDLDAYREALERSTAPARTSRFLQIAADGKPPALREMLDFHPLDHDHGRQTQGTEAQLHQAVHAARRWRLGVAALVIVLLTVTASAWRLLASRETARHTEYAARDASVLPLPAVATQSLPAPASRGPIGADNPSVNWTVRVTKPEAQQVAMLQDEDVGKPVIRLTSDKPVPMALRARRLAAAKGMRFKLALRIRCSAQFQGHAAMSLVEECEDGTSRLLVHYPLENLRHDRWKYCHKTSPQEGLPQDGIVHWILEGEFKGVIEVHTCTLERVR